MAGLSFSPRLTDSKVQAKNHEVMTPPSTDHIGPNKSSLKKPSVAPYCLPVSFTWSPRPSTVAMQHSQCQARHTGHSICHSMWVLSIFAATSLHSSHTPILGFSPCKLDLCWLLPSYSAQFQSSLHPNSSSTQSISSSSAQPSTSLIPLPRPSFHSAL